MTLCACGPGDSSTNTSPDIPASTSTATLVYQFGGTDAEAWSTLGERILLDFDGAGRLHVLDGANDRTFVVDREGNLAWEYAHSGRGPGEFEDPVALAVRADGGQVVADAGNQALIALSADGEHVGNTPLGMESGFPSGLLLSFGSEVVAALGTDAYGLAVGEDEAATPVAAHALGGSEWRGVLSAWRAPVPEGEAQSLTVGARTLRIRAAGLTNLKAFWPTVRTAKVGERIAVVDSTTYRITLGTIDGRVLATVARPIDPIPASEGVREAERRRRLGALAQGEGPLFQISNSDGSVQSVDPAQLRSFMTGQIEAMTFWPEVPVIAGMLGGPDGVLWVRRASPDGSSAGPIDWISESGEYLGTLPRNSPFPAALGPGGLEAYVDVDALGVATVTVQVRRTSEREGNR